MFNIFFMFTEEISKMIQSYLLSVYYVQGTNLAQLNTKTDVQLETNT